MLEQYPHNAAAEYAYRKLRAGEFIWWGREIVKDGRIERKFTVRTILQNKSDGAGMGSALTKMRKVKRAMKDIAFRNDAKGVQKSGSKAKK